MQINGVSFLDRAFSISTTPETGSATVTNTQFDPERLLLANAYSKAADLGDALSELDRLISAAKPQQNRAALVSSTQLNLAGAALTATTLASTEEINATATSFSPFGPDYNLPASSTALPTLDGVYDGSNGTGTLTFEARSTGIHGSKDLRFKVYDPEGNEIDDFKVKKGDPIDQQYTLSNGLLFTLGAGSTAKNDTFNVDVFADVGSVVDPDKPLNGLRNENPNLQFGETVIDGSFEINGETITVNATDSINDLLARITASAADVTAIFDAATETIQLTRNTLGSPYDITFENDTSGFLQATKLSTATSVPGTDGNDTTLIGELPQFSSVTSGAFKINGIDIALDTTSDSLDDIIDRINASDAAVTASLRNNRVYLQAGHGMDFITLEDNDTGFFNTLNIKTGTFRLVRHDGVSTEEADDIVAATQEARAAVDRLFNTININGQGSQQVANLQNRVEQILASAEGKSNDDSTAPLGLDFNPGGFTGSSRIEVDINTLLNNLRINFSDVKAVFLGETEDARAGFVRQLLDVVNQFTAGLKTQYGNNGILSGLYA